MPQLVWAADANGNWTFANRRWRNYTGQDRDEWRGLGFANALHREDRAPMLERWERSWRTGEPYEIEYRLRRHDGEHRRFLCRGAPERGRDRGVEGWVGTCTDVHNLSLSGGLPNFDGDVTALLFERQALRFLLRSRFGLTAADLAGAYADLAASDEAVEALAASSGLSPEACRVLLGEAGRAAHLSASPGT